MWKQRSFREQFQSDEHAGAAGSAVVADDAHVDDQDDAPADGTPGDDANASADDQPADADDEMVITLGDEAPAPTEEDQLELSPHQNAAWARMRKTERELKQRVRELEQLTQAGQQQAAPKVDEVGPEPTLEGCDFDAEAYAEAKVAHAEKKRTAETKAAAARQEQEAAQAEWTKTQRDYRSAASALKVNGFEDAEAAVTAVLSPTQIGIMLQAASPQSAAQLVAALGRAPAELKKLADIKNPIKYTVAVAELVGKLKVAPKKQAPPAERQLRSSAGGATGVDNTLAKLQADADKSGDRSKVAAYLRKQRQAA
ncbi:hypothetical protein [Massilia phyllosphaerae]|uniref:hypothetical protein n=1 Tax=Massilia phyllosphaerae TaxID=3106034 RepID=UPI002B1CCF40|nr:hypothetical protein [Massilia sp. SGZ-792]